MEQEIEIKFNMPLNLDTGFILKRLETIVQQDGFVIISPKIVNRTFQYYDTPNLDVYKRGETIRRVGGFDRNSSKGAFRYDFKVGPIDNRYEANHWADETLDPTEILDQFNLRKFYSEIFPSASATTQHHKMKLQKGKVLIEATLDYFKLLEGAEFRELELELGSGDVSDLKDISKQIQIELGLERSSKQKYSRVIESIPKYKSLLSNSPPV